MKRMIHLVKKMSRQMMRTSSQMRNRIMKVMMIKGGISRRKYFVKMEMLVVKKVLTIRLAMNLKARGEETLSTLIRIFEIRKECAREATLVLSRRFV